MARMNKIFCVILIILLSINIIDAVEIVPTDISIRVCDIDMNYSGDQIDCVIYVEGIFSVTKITANITLEKQNTNGTYAYVDSWNVSSNSRLLSAQKDAKISNGSTYKLTISGTAYKGSATEKFSKVSEMKTDEIHYGDCKQCGKEKIIYIPEEIKLDTIVQAGVCYCVWKSPYRHETWTYMTKEKSACDYCGFKGARIINTTQTHCTGEYL